MSDIERYPEVLSSYESARRTGKASLLDYCRRFGVDYYHFLSWYRNYKKQFPADSCIALSPVHVVKSSSKASVRASSESHCPPLPSDIISFRLKLGNGIEISKRNTTIESLLSLLEKLSPLC